MHLRVSIYQKVDALLHREAPEKQKACRTFTPGGRRLNCFQHLIQRRVQRGKLAASSGKSHTLVTSKIRHTGYSIKIADGLPPFRFALFQQALN